MPEEVFNDLAKKFRRKLSHTARFYPVDLHCHTPLSPCFGRKDGLREDDISATDEQIAISGCQRGIYLLAITDHHRCEKAKDIADASDKIKAAGEDLYLNNNLLILPGMEISVEENTRNVHVLAIFPENTSSALIERILDDTGIEVNPESRTNQSKVTTKRLIEITHRISDRGGLSILAHVNSTNGYRGEMRAIRKSEEEILENILALQVHAVEISKPDDEPHFIHNNKQIPCVIGSDAHYLSDIGGKEYITRIKMTSPSFRGLKRAFEDPETRIRFQDPKGKGIKKILGIKFDGGFLDEQIVPFSSNLNCLIGGRGAGKSTCIEAIRYLFEKDMPTERKADIEQLRKSVFSDCTAQLIYEDQHGQQYVMQRTYGDPSTKIMSIDGIEENDINLQQSHNLRLSFYGWSEIEGIAQDSAQQLNLIDSYIDEINDIKIKEQAAIDALKANARDVESTLEEIKLEDTKVGNLKELVRELTKIGEKQKEEELNKEKIDNESRLLDFLNENLGSLYDEIEEVNIKDKIKEISEHIGEELDEDRLLFTDVFEEIIVALVSSVKKGSKLMTARKNYLSELSKIKSAIKTKEDILKDKHKPVYSAFARLLEELEQPEAKKLTIRREQLRKDIRIKREALDRKLNAKRKLNEYNDQRAILLKELEQVRTTLFDVRNKHVSQIAKKLPKGKSDVEVSLSIVKQGGKDAFIKQLNNILTGLHRKWREGNYPTKITEHYTPIEFSAAIKDANISSIIDAGFDEHVALDIMIHLSDKHDVMMELETCECTDLPIIYFNVEGENKRIENLSPGQRCTALLPIILLETDTPLIIDQPEDNLDNQFIFDLIVNSMRSLKECRQIIVATHNPNIPVSGDAENIVVFKPSGTKGKIERNGSIDYNPVIEDVKTIMEGGEEAFLVRVKKYGL